MQSYNFFLNFPYSSKKFFRKIIANTTTNEPNRQKGRVSLTLHNPSFLFYLKIPIESISSAYSVCDKSTA